MKKFGQSILIGLLSFLTFVVGTLGVVVFFRVELFSLAWFLSAIPAMLILAPAIRFWDKFWAKRFEGEADETEA